MLLATDLSTHTVEEVRDEEGCRVHTVQARERGSIWEKGFPVSISFPFRLASPFNVSPYLELLTSAHLLIKDLVDMLLVL